MKVELEMLPKEALLKRHGLQEGGPVQKFIDNEAMRYMSDYMPRRQAGELEHMMVEGTVIGTGVIAIPGPFAHYLHDGILFVSPTTGSAWAKQDEVKVPTDKELQYTGAPMRGKKFFNRMKADHKDDILEGAQAVADRGIQL
ncbi:minor capsid protein [Lacrimispora brassicae]